MKTKTCIFAILLAAGLISSRAQDTWTQKADFGGTARYGATGFSIGSKGYIGTGFDYRIHRDFWEYDSVTNIWTQKADFGGTARVSATGFSIGNKGYVGTGWDGNYHKDFWEYDPVTNTWTQKADFGGTVRSGATGFSIGSKGYIGTGECCAAVAGNVPPFQPDRRSFVGIKTNASYYKDFWEYDPVSNTWTQKADFGGTGRFGAIGFSIGSKGYIGTGVGEDYYKDFWEYDPATNIWTQKADFGGTARYLATGFSIGSKGYIGTGVGEDYYKDFWEYDPATNIWTQKADFGGTARYLATGFSIGSKGYIGTGGYGAFLEDFWEYTPEESGSLSLLSAASRKKHDNAGTFDIDLPLTGTPGVECRVGNGGTFRQAIVFTFSQAVTSITGNTTTTCGSVNSTTINGSTVAVELGHVNCDGSDLTVTVHGVNGASGSVDASATMTLRTGDVNADGVVGTADLKEIRINVGRGLVNEDNFRDDITVDGKVNHGDTTLEKSKL